VKQTQSLTKEEPHGFDFGWVEGGRYSRLRRRTSREVVKNC